MIRIKYYCLLIFIYSFQSCYKGEVILDSSPNETLELARFLEFDGKDCFFDNSTKSLRYSIEADSIENFAPYVQFQDYSEISINNIPLTNNSVNNLGTVRLNEAYIVKITTQGTVNNLTLTFTNLPIVRIATPFSIVNEPKKLARFTINYPAASRPKMTSFVGIEFRGGHSIKYPKKSYGFSFLRSMDMSEKTSKSLFDWNANEDGILDAMYIDKSRLRNKSSFEVWKAMNPSKHKAIQSEFVELYVNHDFQGLYCLNEQMNAEQLDLYNSESVLYKATGWADGATTFEYLDSPAPLLIDKWDGWEQKYPNPNNRINWQPLYDLRDLIVNKNDADFIDDILSKIDLAIFVDFYIFLNLTSASDNVGKNMIWVQDDALSPFFVTPWDLDGTWGRYWDGVNQWANDVLGNKLFDRLLTLNPGNFKSQLRSRWLALRGGVLTVSNLERLFARNFDELRRSDIITLENLKWDVHIDIQQEQSYINNWTLNRLNFLDVYFANL